MKTRNICPNMKANASSGYTNTKVMANCRQYGFSGMAAKPYNSGALEKILLDSIYTSESEKAALKRRKEQENSGTGIPRILLTGDEQAVIMALGKNLRDLGYAAEFARNGDEAISMYMKALESGHSLDICLIDLDISEGLGGEETMRRLIKIEPEIRAISPVVTPLSRQ